MAQLDDLQPEISPEVPGCPYPSILIAARNAVIEFCEKSLFWAVDADPIDVEANKHTYELESTESDSLVAGVIMAAHEGTPLDPTSEDLLDLQWPSYQNQYKSVLRYGLGQPWRTVTAEKPCLYFCPDPRHIRLVGIPETASAGGLTMKLGLKPAPDSEDFGDIVYEEYHEALAYGALYRLMMQAGKAWGNPKGAATYRAMFMSEIEEAKGRRLSGHTRQDTVVTRTRSYYK